MPDMPPVDDAVFFLSSFVTGFAILYSFSTSARIRHHAIKGMIQPKTIETNPRCLRQRRTGALRNYRFLVDFKICFYLKLYVELSTCNTAGENSALPRSRVRNHCRRIGILPHARSTVYGPGLLPGLPLVRTTILSGLNGNGMICK